MAVLSNSFEGGTEGANITVANSGGGNGNAFDGVAFDNFTEYDNAFAAHGSQSGLLAASANAPAPVWNTSWPGSTTVWTRAYMRFTDATPAASTVIHEVRELNGTTVGCDVRLTTTGTIQLRAPATLRYTSSTVITDNSWFRIELQVDSSATVGHIQCRLFVGANVNGTTADESFGSAVDNWDTGDGTVGGWRTGWGTTSTANMWIDEVSMSDVGWLGPYVAPGGTPRYVGVLNVFGVLAAAAFGLGAFGTIPFGQ